MSLQFDYRTPGVYVEESDSLPPSVVEASSAVPAFIGYTTKGTTGKVQSAAVSTLLEYEERFGQAAPTNFKVEVKNNDAVLEPLVEPLPASMLWYAMSLYFNNGGGRCWVISVGNTNDDRTAAGFKNGLNALDEIDEPTLIVMPEIVGLGKDYKMIAEAALLHCHDHRGRFAILDVPQDTDAKTPDPAANFRNQVDSNLNYGAAYYPYLDTILAHYYEDGSVTVNVPPPSPPVSLTANDERVTAVAKLLSNEVKGKVKEVVQEVEKKQPYDSVVNALSAIDSDQAVEQAISTAIKMHYEQNKEWPTREAAFNSGVDAAKVLWADNGILKDWKDNKAVLDEGLDHKKLDARDKQAMVVPMTLGSLKATDTARYNKIKRLLAEQRVRLPPSPAIAGVYARVDRERGVWKAPANVALASVIGPAVAISDAQQERLNVDDGPGKSINAIRSFAGRGSLVWGARTLAGNDNQWRYIPVRRLFLTIEKSAKQATAFAVYEHNDATTWLKVKGMLESYLYGLWQQGALQGAEPKAAYYVSVGLDKTMTKDDLQKGRMIVEIGLAAVRPAEFIVLKFSHKLAES